MSRRNPAETAVNEAVLQHVRLVEAILETGEVDEDLAQLEQARRVRPTPGGARRLLEGFSELGAQLTERDWTVRGRR